MLCVCETEGNNICIPIFEMSGKLKQLFIEILKNSSQLINLNKFKKR